MSFLALRDWPTVRQWIQVVAAAVLTALVSNQLLDSHIAEIVVTFIAAVLPPALSIFNSGSTIRTWIYTLIAAGQTAILALDIWSVLQVTSIANVLLAIAGAGVSVTHAPTPAAVQGPVPRTPAVGTPQ